MPTQNGWVYRIGLSNLMLLEATVFHGSSKTSNLDYFSRQCFQGVNQKVNYGSNLHTRTDIDELAESLGIHVIDDWYKVAKVDEPPITVRELMTFYPFSEWQVWRFDNVRVPSGFWFKTENQQKLFDWIASVLNIESIDDWYKVTKRDLLHLGAIGVMDRFAYSPSEALKEVYPDEPWQLWKFENLPLHFWHDPKNREQYIEWMCRCLHIDLLDDWYDVTDDDIANLAGGRSWIHYANGRSITRILKELFPQAEWLPWLTGELDDTSAPFWSDINNQKTFLDWLKVKLQLQKDRDWYNVSRKQIMDNGGKALLQLYNGSVALLIQRIYEGFQTWYPWMFVDLEQEFWDDLFNQQMYVEWLSEALGIRTISDWYQIQCNDIQGKYGLGLIRKYGGQLTPVFNKLFPDINWHPWLFGETDDGFWEDSSNRISYFKWLAQELTIEKPEEWFTVKKSEVIQRGGAGLVKTNKGYPAETLKLLHPDILWNPWLFDQAPNTFWLNSKNHRKYFDWIAEQLNVARVDDWYHVNTSEVMRRDGGHVLIHYYGSSLNQALKTVYPLTVWLAWKFDVVSKGFWNAPVIQRDYLDWLESELDIYETEDWYRVSSEQVILLHGLTLLKREGHFHQ